ncbi:hypothetical protein [Kineobactrum salinum]|uniref:Uncharacterized protein n=1 Tax=Kineobactrum salinum TaxID=2708301 RepID=A0A6C0U3H4_9GAMM|nr:hypothetical protein [Kineobactrum salinum]QIB66641.1 hypothetical protein G3T16_15830 [Kineobactrum salinum]
MPGNAGPQPAGTEAAAGHDSAPGSESGQTTEQQQEWQAWVALLQQLMATGSQFASVLGLEVKLALADSGRLVIVLLAMLPLLLFAWLGLSVLAGWLVYVLSQSVALGLLGFVLVQVLALLVLRRAATVFKRSLGLPASRRQLRAIMETGKEHAATATDS